MPAGVGRGTGAVLHMHVSEKSSRGQKMNQYTFVVRPRATKPEIAKDVESRYKVTVRSVKVLMLPGKRRAIGRYVGSTPTLKKAVVVIAPGQTIANA